jgi:protein-L-isoaspartate(D-aspartate) O-methyltransferase
VAGRPQPSRWRTLQRVAVTLAGILVALLMIELTPSIAETESSQSADQRRMVKLIEARGVANPRVLEAMRKVPRHPFVPEAMRERAYDDNPLPIGSGQTISQPYIVAAMTELLDPAVGDTVLEIGTGSGYQAAVLSELVHKVYSIEIIAELAEGARKKLAELDYDNVVVITGDGSQGLPAQAPFDGIIVTAAPEKIPQQLIDQLAVGGRLVIPVGVMLQELVVLERTSEGVHTRRVFPVRFVPMTGEVRGAN